MSRSNVQNWFSLIDCIRKQTDTPISNLFFLRLLLYFTSFLVHKTLIYGNSQESEKCLESAIGCLMTPQSDTIFTLALWKYNNWSGRFVPIRWTQRLAILALETSNFRFVSCLWIIFWFETVVESMLYGMHA
jgi:hypothetical protein